jgi:hypothetical protein
MMMTIGRIPGDYGAAPRHRQLPVDDEAKRALQVFLAVHFP